jgi:shikimate dehydrogenase
MKSQEQSKIYGLVGRNIGYSFSKKFFTEKFKKEKINCVYTNFDIKKNRRI